ncbi:Lrp/AsnC family transcriptional regulator [Brevibacterium moorei]|uniref:Lrp/AsnC family transcriptional regulator n=1 Tax=Brevibacterium moorei TaxID=2968457 RepID=UPI00211C627F|nr:Lrp/AsnC family transcriptional regulator [Brevibacterium sp. 68QC2CO]MCQ9385478.1 Lrp/AsnC family transcriptional regulator [Brevibacterium sp. 68QC2CO]
MEDHAVPLLDDTDLRIVACLRASGRATATEIAEAAGIEYATARRCLAHLLDSDTVQITALVDPALLDQSVVGFLWLHSRALHTDIGVRLAAKHGVNWATLTIDGRTAVAQINCATPAEFLTLTDEIRAWPGVDALESAIVMRSYIGPRSASTFRLPGTSATAEHSPTQWLGGTALEAVDDTDREILHVLRADGRATLTQIAEAVAIPLSTARRRVNRLLSSPGVRMQCRVKPAALGLDYYAGVSIRVHRDAGGLARTLAVHPATSWVSEVTGPAAVTVEFLAADQAEMTRAIDAVLADERVADVRVDYYSQNVKDTGLW